MCRERGEKREFVNPLISQNSKSTFYLFFQFQCIYIIDNPLLSAPPGRKKKKKNLCYCLLAKNSNICSMIDYSKNCANAHSHLSNYCLVFFGYQNGPPQNVIYVADFPFFAINSTAAPTASANFALFPSVISVLCVAMPNGISIESRFFFVINQNLFQTY